jgi:uncharacterized small protein (DUF1192 family)
MTNADNIAENLVAAATKDVSLAAIAIIMDCLEGKPQQQQQRDLTSSDKRGVREWTMEELDRRIAELTTAVERGKAPASRNGQMRKIF